MRIITVNNSFKQRAGVYKMRLNGYPLGYSRRWQSAVEAEKANKAYDAAGVKWAHEHGYTYSVASRYNINESNYKEYVSLKDYVYLDPINDIFRKWFRDIITTRKVLKPFKEYLTKQYYHLYIRDGEPFILKLDDCPSDLADTIDDIVELLRRKKRLAVRRASGIIMHILHCRDNELYLDGSKIEEGELKETLLKNTKADEIVVSEFSEDSSFMNSDKEGRPNIVRAIVTNKHFDDPEISQAYVRINGPDIEKWAKRLNAWENDNLNAEKVTKLENDWIEDCYLIKGSDSVEEIPVRYYYAPIDRESGCFNGAKYLTDDNKIIEVAVDHKNNELSGEVPHWKDINTVLEDICRYIPQIEIFSVDIVITENSFKYIKFEPFPLFPQVVGFNSNMTEYIKMKVDQKTGTVNNKAVKSEILSTRIDVSIWSRMVRIFGSKGMKRTVYKLWCEKCRDDLFTRNGFSLSQKIWAHRHGFVTYRIPQYGITKKNVDDYISDYEYLYIKEINNRYLVWLKDKLTVKYVCSEHKQYFPAYYYQYAERNGERKFIQLMDLPKGCGTDEDSLFRLVEEVGQLACKPKEGSQGKGFYKFSYENGKYYMNHIEKSKEEIIEILTDEESNYFITEYIVQHDVINKIYSGAVNTLRIITFMKDGKHQEIGQVYMRIGSKKTGAVDNMGAGGMYAQVDMETGRFGNGKIITENGIEPCPRHPDTDALIEGVLPNWDIIKKGIVELNQDMPQLEFLGFDVAITPDGMKLPEINSGPGFPKIETLNRKTIDYLLYKKQKKMEKNGITRLKTDK